MKKLFLSFAAITTFITIPVHAHLASGPMWGHGNKEQLEKAQWSAIKSGAYTAAYFFCKAYIPTNYAHVGVQDWPVSIYFPVNAPNAAAGMAIWNAVKAVVHYRNYEKSKKFLGYAK